MGGHGQGGAGRDRLGRLAISQTKGGRGVISDSAGDRLGGRAVEGETSDVRVLPGSQ